jgi:hypothetical protein
MPPSNPNLPPVSHGFATLLKLPSAALNTGRTSPSRTRGWAENEAKTCVNIAFSTFSDCPAWESFKRTPCDLHRNRENFFRPRLSFSIHSAGNPKRRPGPMPLPGDPRDLANRAPPPSSLPRHPRPVYGPGMPLAQRSRPFACMTEHYRQTLSKDPSSKMAGMDGKK